MLASPGYAFSEALQRGSQVFELAVQYLIYQPNRERKESKCEGGPNLTISDARRKPVPLVGRYFDRRPLLRGQLMDFPCIGQFAKNLLIASPLHQMPDGFSFLLDYCALPLILAPGTAKSAPAKVEFAKVAFRLLRSASFAHFPQTFGRLLRLQWNHRLAHVVYHIPQK